MAAAVSTARRPQYSAEKRTTPKLEAKNLARKRPGLRKRQFLRNLRGLAKTSSLSMRSRDRGLVDALPVLPCPAASPSLWVTAGRARLRRQDEDAFMVRSRALLNSGLGAVAAGRQAGPRAARFGASGACAAS